MKKEDKITPYTTKTGIRIGEFYERKPSKDLTYDMELIQLAMLNDQSFIRKERFKSLGVMLAVCGFIFILMLVTKN